MALKTAVCHMWKTLTGSVWTDGILQFTHPHSHASLIIVPLLTEPLLQIITITVKCCPATDMITNQIQVWTVDQPQLGWYKLWYLPVQQHYCLSMMHSVPFCWKNESVALIVFDCSHRNMCLHCIYEMNHFINFHNPQIQTTWFFSAFCTVVRET